MGDQYFGKYSGIVKDNSDENNLGHLQLSVPALFQADDLIEARPALPYGLFFVPEKDQRVWVEFEGGDPGLPIWTGVQSIPGSWPDEAKADPPQKRVIKTASGHLMILDDKSGEAGIKIIDGVNGHAITLNKDGIDVQLGGSAPHEIKMTSDGVTITHATAGDLKLDSSGLTLETKAGAKGITIDAGTGSVQVTATSVQVNAPKITVGTPASNVQLGTGLLPVVTQLDQGIGNLGAPVPIMITRNVTTLA